jgi:hypothetical protein
MGRSVSKSLPNVNSVSEKSAAQDEETVVEDDSLILEEEGKSGPLFRVGEIWRANDVFNAISKKDSRMKQRLIDSGLKPWGEGHTALILIDQLAEMILQRVEIKDYVPQYKQRGEAAPAAGKPKPKGKAKGKGK